MPQKDFDRVLETSASQGAGDVQLAGAVMGYQSLADAGAVDGDPVDLYLEDVFPSTGVPTGAWECGTYTWRTGGILQRTTIRGSSNAGQPVTWGPGLRRVGAGLLSYMIQAIRSVSGLQAEVIAVAGVASSVPTVAAHAADVTTVAGSIGSVTTVAGAIANVNAVAPRVADVQALVPSVGAIAAVAPHIADVTAVAGNMANVTAVAGNATNINAVAADKANIDLVAGDKASIDAVAGDLVRIDAVAGNKANIDMVAATKTNIDAVVAAKANVDTVAGAIANVNAVAVDRANIDAVAGALGTVNTVAADLVNLNNVAGELTHINQVAAVLPNVATVATNVAAIASVAADMTAVKAVANDLANVDAVLTNKPNIDTVAGNMNSVATVAGIQPAVQSVAANMPAVQAVGPSIPAIQAVYAALPTIVGSPATASAIAASAAAALQSSQTAIAQAGLATAQAQAASSVAQQDLSGATLAALHRSTNTVVQAIVYDTSRDYDGGAWREKCAHLSWMNEPLNGNWLTNGAANGFQSELAARATGATLGAEMNPSGTNFATWTPGSNVAIVGGKVTVTNAGLMGTSIAGVPAVIGQAYVVSITIDSLVAGGAPGSGGISVQIGGVTAVSAQAPGTYVDVVIATTTASFQISPRGTGVVAGTVVSAASCKPITAFNTKSGDYYPSATDGKFYRLWKNLLPFSENGLSNWTKNGTPVITPSGGTVGGIAADLLSTAGANAGVYKLAVATAYGAGDTFSLQALVKYVSGTTTTRLRLEGAAFPSLTGITFDAQAGTYTPTGIAPLAVTVAATNDGGWLVTMTCRAEAAGAVNVTAYSVDANPRSVLVTALQLERGTPTAYEAKPGADGSVSETFTGNTNKHPRLVADVAEAGRVVRYALDQPGRPMWKVFATGAGNLLSTGAITSIAATNGWLLVGQAGTGLRLVNFIAESQSGAITNGGRFQYLGTLAQRNAGAGFALTAATQSIVSGQVNAVAAMIRPTAPLDPVTGLPIPTIGVAVGTGNAGQVGSVIMDDGSVVNYAQASNDGKSVAFTARGDVVWGLTSTTAVYAMPLATSNVASLSAAARGYFNNTPVPTGSATSKQVRAAGSAIAAFGVGSDANKLVVVKENPSTPGAGLAAHITGTYNTGWMPGDIRRATFISTAAGVASGAELITNGTFDTGIAGWIDASTAPATFTWDSTNKAALLTRTDANSARMQQSFATIPGRSYVLSLTVAQASVTIGVGTTAGGADVSPFAGKGIGISAVEFTAATATTWFVAISSGIGTASVDNISIKEVVSDRSAKAKPATINGSLTLTAVAAASQLVAWGGFSATNYAQEAYSADHDPALAAFGGSAWFNVPATGFGPANFVVSSEDATFAGFNRTSVTVTANVDGNADKIARVSGTAGYLSTGTPSGMSTAPGTYHYRVRAKQGAVGGRIGLRVQGTYPNRLDALFDLTTGTLVGAANGGTATGVTASISAVAGQPGYYDMVVAGTLADSFNQALLSPCDLSATNPGTFEGAPAATAADEAIIAQQQLGHGLSPAPYVATTGTAYNGIAPIYDRSAPTGAYYRWGVDGNGMLACELSDGTTTRRVTTAQAVNTGTWVKGAFDYVPNGAATTLTVKVNGVQQAQVTGTALLTMNNANALLTWGQARTLDAAFPGVIDMVKLSMTIPTPEQSAWMYEQERQMFRDGAQVTLADTGNLVDMAYDAQEASLTVCSATMKSKFVGLVRVQSEAPAAGAFSGVGHTAGIKLLQRTGTNPGVDITLPSQNLKEELLRRSEDAAARARLTRRIDFDTIAGQTDIAAPIGWEWQGVTLNGIEQREGAAKQWTRLFDGFIETVHLNAAPGAAWVQGELRRAA